MGLFFRNIKYKDEINCSFFVDQFREGEDPLEKYFVGDIVSLLLSVTKNQAESINNLSARNNVRAFTLSGERWHVQLPFVVVERRHGVSYQGKMGHLQSLSLSVTLEAVSGLWEDVFLWLCCEEIPAWALDNEG